MGFAPTAWGEGRGNSTWGGGRLSASGKQKGKVSSLAGAAFPGKNDGIVCHLEAENRNKQNILYSSSHHFLGGQIP